MNITDLKKNNTDYQNDTDWKNAIARGMGYEEHPMIATPVTLPTASSGVSTIDDYIPGGAYKNGAAATVTLPDPATCRGKYLSFFVKHISAIVLKPASVGGLVVLGEAAVTATLPTAKGGYAVVCSVSLDDGATYKWYVVETNAIITVA